MNTFHLLETPVLKGAVAYAVWMLNSEFEPTKFMGAELCGNFVGLSDWLKLPNEVVDYVNQALEKQGQKDFPAGSVGIIRQWLEEAKEKPLATWHRDGTLASDEHPLSP